MNDYWDELEVQSEEYWNSLSKQQQLDCFCAVMRRVYRGDVELRGSYRYVLYDVFGFGPNAYAPAQLSGYLSIHNLIWDAIEAEEQEEKALGFKE